MITSSESLPKVEQMRLPNSIMIHTPLVEIIQQQ